MTGLMNEPKIHVFVYEFDWGNNTGDLWIEFESKEGSFTTVSPINGMAVLFFPIDQNEARLFHLYFPNTLSKQMYDDFVTGEGWKIKTTLENNTISILASTPSKYQIFDFAGTPPVSNFETVWTQEGYLIIDENPLYSEKLEKSNKLVLGNALLMEKVISIQPSDVNLEIKSNNYNLDVILKI